MIGSFPSHATLLQVSGHRLSTVELESAISLHKHVTEAAVVGFPHPIKGEGTSESTFLSWSALHTNCYDRISTYPIMAGVFGFVVLKPGVPWNAALHRELVAVMRKAIGPIASPDVLLPTPDLPKTRSGKIMRRFLKRIAAGETDVSAMGDASTLSNPAIVADLVAAARVLREHNASSAASGPGAPDRT